MKVPVFVDTNVLVYARDAAQPDKQAAAAHWLASLWQERSGRVSMQVLHEYYATVTRKLRPGMSTTAARADVRSLLAWQPIVLDAPVLDRAFDLEERHRLSWWDSLIVSAAQVAGSRYLLTEDLQHGQDLDGVRVLNPFVVAPAQMRVTSSAGRRKKLT